MRALCILGRDRDLLAGLSALGVEPPRGFNRLFMKRLDLGGLLAIKGRQMLGEGLVGGLEFEAIGLQLGLPFLKLLLSVFKVALVLMKALFGRPGLIFYALKRRLIFIPGVAPGGGGRKTGVKEIAPWASCSISTPICANNSRQFWRSVSA